MDKNNLYPIFLKLEELQVLLVGAGNVGLEKLESVLKNAPKTNITIVAPFVKEEVKSFIKNYPNCILKQKEFEDDDLNNKQIAILATDNKNLHSYIKSIAIKKNILVNVADTPDLCDFYLGSIVQKGNLKIAISTNGKSPTIAKRIKETLQHTLPEEIDELLLNMQNIRNKMSGDFAQKVKELNELTKQLALK